MKISKKIIALFMSVLMIMVLISGCGKSTEKLSPKESLRILVDVNIFGKTDEIEKVGITKSAYELLNKTKNDEFKKSFFASSGFNEADLDPQMVEKFINQVFTALGKAEINYASEEINGDKATVKLEIKGLDFKKIAETTLKEAVAIQLANPNIEEKEFLKKFIEIYGKNIELAPLVATAQTISVEMTSKDKYWDVLNPKEVEVIMNALMKM